MPGSQKGFSLVELMLASVILAVALAGMFVLIDSGKKAEAKELYPFLKPYRESMRSWFVTLWTVPGRMSRLEILPALLKCVFQRSGGRILPCVWILSPSLTAEKV